MRNKNPNLKIEVNQIDEKGKASMKSRVIVGVIMAVVCIPCLVFGGWFWFGLLAFAMLIAIYEMIRSPQRKYRWFIYLVTYVLVTMFFGWFLIKNNLVELESFNAHKEIDPVWAEAHPFVASLETNCKSLSVSIPALMVSLMIFFFVAVLHDDFDLRDVCYLFTCSILVGLGFQALLYVRFFPTANFAKEIAAISDTAQRESANAFMNSPTWQYWQSMLLLLFVIILIMGNDIFAYFVGVLFGKHHMNPRISPKKTWEGFFGGWIISAGVGAAFAFIVDACGFPILKGYIDTAHWYWIVLLALALPLFGNLGDFSFSLIKRTFGFKDFGTLLKAHGGVLDRIDSLIFGAIACAILLTFITNNWNFLA